MKFIYWPDTVNWTNLHPKFDGFAQWFLDLCDGPHSLSLSSHHAFPFLLWHHLWIHARDWPKELLAILVILSNKFSKESLEVSGLASLSSFALRNFLLHKKRMACFPSSFLITSFPWWNTLDSSLYYCSWQWNCLKTFWSWQRDCIFNLFVRGKGIGFFCSLLINMYGVDLTFSSTLLMPSVFCSSGSVRYEVFACFFPCHGQKDEISQFGFAFSASNYGTNELFFSCYTMWPTVIIQSFSCSLFPLLSFQKYLSFLFKMKKYLYLSSSIKMKEKPFFVREEKYRRIFMILNEKFLEG